MHVQKKIYADDVICLSSDDEESLKPAPSAPIYSKRYVPDDDDDDVVILSGMCCDIRRYLSNLSICNLVLVLQEMMRNPK